MARCALLRCARRPRNRKRHRRRLARYLAEVHPLPGKTLDSFSFDVVPGGLCRGQLDRSRCQSAAHRRTRRLEDALPDAYSLTQIIAEYATVWYNSDADSASPSAMRCPLASSPGPLATKQEQRGEREACGMWCSPSRDNCRDRERRAPAMLRSMPHVSCSPRAAMCVGSLNPSGSFIDRSELDEHYDGGRFLGLRAQSPCGVDPVRWTVCYSGLAGK